MKDEIWRDIAGYEGIYQISNLGRICSLDRPVSIKNGKFRIVKGKIKETPKPNGVTGYVCVSLYNKNKCKSTVVHRLVAFAFQDVCGKYFEGAEVDHINTIRHDNRAENLRWCTRIENHMNPITYEREKENIKKAVEAKKGKPAWNKGIKMPQLSGENHSRSRAIKQIDKEGNIIKIWVNTSFAAYSLNTSRTNITNCLSGRSSSAAGFKWEYA